SFGVELGDKRLNKRYITMVRSIMNALRIWNLQPLIVHVIAREADSLWHFAFRFICIVTDF
ncbi:MAG: transposase, partial [Planctomycetaceae bacterium]|nr:transposase [Planctomycetaceae bacterium]